MSAMMACPICGPVYGGKADTPPPNGDYVDWDCGICGRFHISGRVNQLYFRDGTKSLSNLERASLSHRLCQRTDSEDIAKISSYLMDEIVGKSRLPHASQQAANLIRLIGDYVSNIGNPYLPVDSTLARIGVIDQKAFARLREQLIKREQIMEAGIGKRKNAGGGNTTGTCYDLTLDGWEKYDEEKKGKVSGKYGFIALKFGDPTLDTFLNDVIKPIIKDGLGFQLVDMRDAARAGIIDNIMRAQIRDSAFVLVDLTHDNSGAYWEAGYAEGLGKPVIYLCERTKYDDVKTHFDTNHCTTVLWSSDQHEQFRREIVATLSRSLNRFPDIAD